MSLPNTPVAQSDNRFKTQNGAPSNKTNEAIQLIEDRQTFIRAYDVKSPSHDSYKRLNSAITDTGAALSVFRQTN